MWKAIVSFFEKWSCKHDWLTIKERVVEQTFADMDSSTTKSTIKATYCCKKCGKFKQIML
jgi:hypothetical protein